MAARSLTLLLIAGLCGCSATEVEETPWEASPGGAWLTRTVQTDTSGPGNNYLATTVQAKRPNQGEPIDLVTLEEMTGPATIQVRWRDPTNLVIAYANAKVVFQVVRVGELSITTGPLASE